MKFILKHFGAVITEQTLEEGHEYFIGRHKDCDFILSEETGISRKHVRIYQSESGLWTVKSLSEWGGLYLEGDEIESIELSQSCSLSLKNYVLEFVEADSAEAEQELKEGAEAPEALSASKASETGPRLHVHTSEEGTRLVPGESLIHSLYVFIDGEFSDHIHLNEEEAWTIGRSDECDISIDYSILTRKHMEISRKQGKFYIKDLASSNKTFLNGKELAPNTENLLRANDEISVSDLKIIFEVRHKNYEKMMSSLPVLNEDSAKASGMPEMALSKVILEDIPVEEAALSKKFIHKKKAVIVLGLLVFVGLAFFFQHEKDQEKQALLAEQQKSVDKKDQLEVFYQEAVFNLQNHRYQPCLELLDELHQMAPSGYFKDSQQIAIQCQNGLNSQREKERRLAQEKLQKETNAKIQKIAEECKGQYAEGKIKTEMDLNRCAEELLSGLDPQNQDISYIRMEIEAKELEKKRNEDKKAEFEKSIQEKTALYHRAKKLRNQKKALRAVAAYNVFLKSAKGWPPLKQLSAKARAERDATQKKYDDELNRLYQSCENLIQENRMKEAYYDCKGILSFKSEDKKAKEYVQQAKSSLQKDLKPIYEQSMLDESFSRIDEALKAWNEILKRDIAGGYYHEKAESQIKKYK